MSFKVAVMTTPDHQEPADTTEVSAPVKEKWSKPEIIDYKPVTITQGISYRIGDGISNLTR